MITVGGDDRITKVGGVLRSWKLDELPQLWNVLVGDMSIVGPRPEVPDYVATYSPEIRQLIFSVRPGITDPSSIRMRDESAILAKETDPEAYYRERLLPEKLRLSGEYILRRSVASDVGIVVKTIIGILRTPSSPR